MSALTLPPIFDFGAGALHLNVSSGPAWIVTSFEHIPLDLRLGAFAKHAKDFRYYEIAELSLKEQFEYRYVIMQDSVTQAWAIQPLFFVDQDLLAGLPRSLAPLIGSLRKLWPRFLKLRMLMIGCSAGEGQLDHAEPWVVPALREVIDWYRKQTKPTVILFKDFPRSYRPQLDFLKEHGYQRVPSLPAGDLKLDFADFEEYMSRHLSKVFRKNLRRKFRDCEGAPPITMETVTDVAGIIDEIFPLYMQTFLRSEFRFEELSKEYFILIAERMPDRARYFVWRQNGRIVAFSMCLVHGSTLHDMDIGLDYSVALDLHLYFVTWRDIVKWCLENDITTYHTGPLNYDPKAHLRFILAPQDLYARHNSAILNPFFKIAIKFLEPTRHERTLKKFENFHELN